MFGGDRTPRGLIKTLLGLGLGQVAGLGVGPQQNLHCSVGQGMGQDQTKLRWIGIEWGIL